MKKLKKLNKGTSSSFTLLELVLVIVIIGILAFSLPILVPNNNLQIAADDLIKNIYFTRSLALKDDKYQPFPNNNSAEEGNRSKYWFKQWWQLRFSKNRNNNDWWYEIFSDQPTDNVKVFDGYGYKPSYLRDISLAKDPLTGKYMIGNCDASGFPDCKDSNIKLNLTKTYGIKDIEFVNIINKRVIFDNFGNIFLKEGEQEDANDINPIDINKRVMLTRIAKIRLCLDDPCNYNKNRCIQINITPTGFVYKSECK